jgi:hypothetical protein
MWHIKDNAEHRKQFKTLAWRLGTKQSLEVIVTSFDNLKEGYCKFIYHLLSIQAIMVMKLLRFSQEK